MASYTVLRDIGETLKRLFIDRIPELPDENSILFDSPADLEATTTARLAVFLYQITENGFLKNSQAEPVGTIDVHQNFQAPPLAIDLAYLMTPYAQTRETELIIIERILQIFHDYPVLRGDMLQGNLAESGNDELRVIRNSLTLDEMNKLWSTFPSKPLKLSLSYLLTPVRIPSERVTASTRVLTKDINLYSLKTGR
jgi:uncharacterized protein DUF4255